MNVNPYVTHFSKVINVVCQWEAGRRGVPWPSLRHTQRAWLVVAMVKQRLQEAASNLSFSSPRRKRLHVFVRAGAERRHRAQIHTGGFSSHTRPACTCSCTCWCLFSIFQDFQLKLNLRKKENWMNNSSGTRNSCSFLEFRRWRFQPLPERKL